MTTKSYLSFFFPFWKPSQPLDGGPCLLTLIFLPSPHSCHPQLLQSRAKVQRLNTYDPNSFSSMTAKRQLIRNKQRGSSNAGPGPPCDISSYSPYQITQNIICQVLEAQSIPFRRVDILFAGSTSILSMTQPGTSCWKTEAQHYSEENV